MMPHRECATHKPVQLTSFEVGAIVRALQTAAQTYRELARKAAADHYENLACQFRRQNVEALDLAEQLEAANIVELR